MSIIYYVIEDVMGGRWQISDRFNARWTIPFSAWLGFVPARPNTSKLNYTFMRLVYEDLCHVGMTRVYSERSDCG